MSEKFSMFMLHDKFVTACYLAGCWYWFSGAWDVAGWCCVAVGFFNVNIVVFGFEVEPHQDENLEFIFGCIRTMNVTFLFHRLCWSFLNFTLFFFNVFIHLKFCFC